jgi:hypothetical protein
MSPPDPGSLPAQPMTTRRHPDPDPDAPLAHALRRSRVLEDAPEASIQRAIDLFQARARASLPAVAPASAPPALRRLLAVLALDSAVLAPQGQGLRAGPTRQGGRLPRQLLYTIDGRDVDVRIEPTAGGQWLLSGQVLGPDRKGRVLLRGGAAVLESAWDELAEFRFEAVPAGRWVLEVEGEDWAAELPALDLAA